MKTQIQLTNQEKIRYDHQKKVLHLMRFGTHSCTDISKNIGLSNTAVENIVDELTEMGILSLSQQRVVVGRGRKPIGFHLNADYGVVVAIDLSGRDLLVCIANTTRQILYRAEIKDVLQITSSVLEEIVGKIREGLGQERVQGKKLLCICIASPGKVDQNTGRFILAPRIEDYKNVNLQTYFESRFGCDVLVKRDIQCGLIGEMQFGVLADERLENAVFLHFDIMLSSALLLGGKVFGGDSGFAGEMGLMSADIGKPASGMDECLSLTSMYMQIKNKIQELPYKHALADKYVLNFDEVKLLFLSGDDTVDWVVKRTAKNLASHLLNVANLLDVWQVVIQGRIIELGDKFLQYVNAYIEKYNRSEEKLCVRYSGLMNKAITLGCIHEGVRSQFDKALLARTNG